MNPSRNFRCIENTTSQNILSDCTKNVGFTDWVKSKVIGKGAFGEISSYNVSKTVEKKTPRTKKLGAQVSIVEKRMTVAVKKAYFKISQNDKKSLNDLYQEVEFNFYMAEAGLGPELYFAFFHVINETKSKLEGYQYFIMEKMDMDCHNYLADKKFTVKEKTNAVLQIVELVNKQIYKYRLLCSDTKPSNCMINVSENKVCLIDFGGTFCHLEGQSGSMLGYVDPDEMLDVFYFTQLLQLKILIKDAIGTYDSPIYDAIDYDDVFFINKCLYLGKYGDQIFLDLGIELHHYTGKNKIKMYEAADCLQLLKPSPKKPSPKKQSPKKSIKFISPGQLDKLINQYVVDVVDMDKFIENKKKQYDNTSANKMNQEIIALQLFSTIVNAEKSKHPADLKYIDEMIDVLEKMKKFKLFPWVEQMKSEFELLKFFRTGTV